MSHEVSTTDLKKIIHELMLFIVNAKKYVGEKKQDKYTLDYIQCFVKTMNLKEETNTESFTADIMYKITKDLKGKKKD